MAYASAGYANPFLVSSSAHKCGGLDLHSVCAYENIHPSLLLHTIQQLINFEAYYYPPPGVIGPTQQEAFHLEERDEAASLLQDVHASYYQLPDQVLVESLSLFQRFLFYVNVPVRCFKLVLACCYFLAAEHWVAECPDEASAALLPNREDLLLLLLGRSCYDMRDWEDWESAIRLRTCPPHPQMPLVMGTAMQFLHLFATGYGVTRDMTRLLTTCLTRSTLVCGYWPRVLAMGVFYASVPTEQWDSLQYVQQLAQLCAIPCQAFLQCCQEVMQVARPSAMRAFTLLHEWRARCGVAPRERRAPTFALDFAMHTIFEEEEEVAGPGRLMTDLYK
jgi:hypothetical protein